MEAARAGRTLTSLIEEGLAVVLERRESARGQGGLPVWTGSRVVAPVNFDDSSAIWGVLDSDGR